MSSERHPGSPEYGTAVEHAVCELFGLERVDRPAVDALDGDGTPVQIKGTQEWVSNGAAGRARGRIDVWQDSLRELLYGDDGGKVGMFVVAVYDPDVFDPDEDDPEHVDPDAFLLAVEWVEAARIEELAHGWHDALRTQAKGQRARLRWSDVLDGHHGLDHPDVDAAAGQDVAADGGRP